MRAAALDLMYRRALLLLLASTLLTSPAGAQTAVAPAPAAAPTAAGERHPNIIFILADDLGIGELGCYGQQKIHTPNVDKLAAEGMRFTQFYAGNAVCAPSRCSLLTGKHMGHAAVRDNQERGPTLEGQLPMPAETVTVAQLLKKAGYYTGIIGKWGLGMPEDHSGPNDFGFDYSYGFLCQRVAHTYFPDHLWRNGVSEPLEKNPPTPLAARSKIEAAGGTYAHDLMSDDALKFVREHKAAPFFLYLAYTIPHFSLQVPEDSRSAYEFPEIPYEDAHYASQPRPRATYAGMISRMDRDVGRLMEELKKAGLDENTVVFFSSDNGVTMLKPEILAEFFGSAGGFRGFKGDLYEGGIRTPFIARWPGHIQPGSKSDYIGAFWDLLPTWCELAGTSAPENDGISILPTLLNAGTQKQHPWLYWEYHSAGSSQAVRMGDWKGIRLKVKANPQAAVELYNLSSDPSEAADVAAQHPEIVATMREIMSQRTPSPVARWNF